MHARIIRSAVAITSLMASAVCSAQMAPLASHEYPMPMDSGLVLNKGQGGDGQAAALVYQNEVRVIGVPWLRLAFDEATLGGSPDLGDGAYLVITSLRDHAKQTLNARSLQEWSQTSAYFNGDAVKVELYAYPNTGYNRIKMSRVTGGTFEVGAGIDTICGTVDDRILSSYPAQARILPMGCTGWLITTGNCANRFLTAGHCFLPTPPASAVVQFNVPLSTAGGGLVNPPPEHQYPVVMASVQATQTVIGNDFAQFFTSANSNTGLHAREAQGGAAYTIGNAPAVAGQTLRVTGYGTTNPNDPVAGGGLPLSQTQVQKTHTGAYTLLSGTRMEYTVDTTGGNSGSPITNGITGSAVAIGIHTNAGCGTGGGANSGTAIQNAGLQAALASPLGTCAPYTASTCLDTIFASDNGNNAGGMVFFDVAVAVGNDLEVTNLVQNVAGQGLPFNVVIYLTPDTSVGKETTPAAWTQVATGSGMGELANTPALVALSNRFTLRAGKNYGVAIQSNQLNHEYTNGTGLNEVYANTNVRITCGRASNALFASLITGERVWNGRLCYRTHEASSTKCLGTILAQDNFGSLGGGVYFNANVSGAANLIMTGLNLNAGTLAPSGTAFTISVYTKSGSFSGFEQTPAAWTLRTAGSGITAPVDHLTPVNFDTPFTLNAGSSNAVAVIMSAAANHAYTNGTGANQNYSNGNLAIQTGSATNAAFSGGVNTPRVFNGSLCYYADVNGCTSTAAEQTPPNPDLGGFNSNAAAGGVSPQQVADSFSVPTARSITGMRLWAVYTGTSGQFAPALQNFTVNIFADAAGSPGALVYTANVLNVPVQDSGAVATAFGARPLFQYDLTIPAFNAAAGTTYWLSPLGTSDSFTWCWQFQAAGGTLRSRSTAAAVWNSFAGSTAFELCGSLPCYANCDQSTGSPLLTANDFQCFINKFAANDPYANCDGSTGTPSLTANDFQCFINAFAAGCP